MQDIPAIFILGPTASGKTKLAVHVAQQINAEIISADSRQIYRNMDIGTGKDLGEYMVDGTPIPYHLINIRNAGEDYNIYEFQKDFYQALEEIHVQNKKVLVCGGTGLYMDAILKGYEHTAIPIDENLRNHLQHKDRDALLTELLTFPEAYRTQADTSTAKRLIRAIEIATYLTDHPMAQSERPTINPIVIGLLLDREERRNRISARLKQRLEQGLVNEVENLIKTGVPPEKLIFYGLEYKFVVQYLQGTFDLQTMTNRLEVAIHQYAKRQMTYFRKMERDGTTIHWINAGLNLSEQVNQVLNLIN